MIVSQQDIDLIIDNFPKKLKMKDFVFKNQNQFYQLKNDSKYCVFLDFMSKTCKVYQYRPQGCRFYPLIYDFIQKKCVFDKDCPRTNLFYQDKQELKKTCQKLKSFLKTEFQLNTE